MPAKRTASTNEGAALGRPLRTIAYVRVSTDLQAERGMGLDVQRERVTEYAQTQGLELVDMVEEAASGGVREGELFSWEHRPALLELVDRAERGEFEVLLVARLDRLSRDFATQVVLERQLRRYGVQIVSADDGENGSANEDPFARYFRAHKAQLAELERDLIRQRLTLGKAAKKRRGGYVGGRPPFGYRAEAGALKVDEADAKVVRYVFELAKDGLTVNPPRVSPAKVARTLNAEGVPSPAGRAWSRQVVGDMLRNSVYAGEMHGVRGAHPRIVSRRLFNAIQSALQRAE